MAQITLVDMNNKKVKDIDLPGIFGTEVKVHLLHTAVVNQLANRRAGTAATKNRALVSGGGKKPWRQKGTGRARAGSIRSPLWRHGGTIFGPVPRDYSYSMPKKERRAAVLSALSSKVNESKIIVLDKIELPEPKTRLMTELLARLGVKENALVLLSGENRNVVLAARNIPGVKVLRTQNLNVYDLLRYRYLITTEDAVETMKEVYGK